MGKQNGTNGNGAQAHEASSSGELAVAITEFAGLKNKVAELDARLVEVKAERDSVLARGKELAARIRELLNLGGRRAGKKRSSSVSGDRPAVRKAGRQSQALELLFDGEIYSTAFFADEFGGTVGAAYQVLKELFDKGMVTRPADGKWTITEKGKQAAAEL